MQLKYRCKLKLDSFGKLSNTVIIQQPHFRLFTFPERYHLKQVSNSQHLHNGCNTDSTVNDPITERCQAKKQEPGREDTSLPQPTSKAVSWGGVRNVILTQSDTWKMTVRHKLTSEHLCNYWCWSLCYQLGNLVCEVISSTWKRRKKMPFAGLPI